jgi:FkbM family methyltransferase
MADLERKLIGFAMRLYRRSPLHPRLGAFLAKILSGRAARRPQGLCRTRIGQTWFDLDLREVIDSSLYYSGTFEPRAERWLQSHVGPGGVVIDVGANIGYHALRLGQWVGAGGFVLAIEPGARTFDRLVHNQRLNVIPALHPRRVFLSDRDLGVLELPVQSSFPLDGRDSISTERCDCRSFDSLVAELNLSRLDLVKCDVDGYEVKVFRGATESLRKFHPPLLFEYNPDGIARAGDDGEELIRLLESFGYLFEDESGRRLDDVRAVLRRIRPGLSLNLGATVRSAAP